MREIPLNNGMFAKVDDEDFSWLMKWVWTAFRNKNTYYAIRYPGVYMHRDIMTIVEECEVVRHRNDDGLDNQKGNLLCCKKGEAVANRGVQKNNKSGYKGVSWYERRGKWRAYIHYKGKQIVLGYFDEVIDAAKAYNEKAQELFGERAGLNII